MSAEVKPAPSTALPLPAPRGEQTGRVVAALAITAFVFAAWGVHLEEISQWHARELRVLPALSTMVLIAFTAMIVQGGRMTARVLMGCGLSALFLLVLLHYFSPTKPEWINVVTVNESQEIETDIHTDAEGSGVMVIEAPAPPPRSSKPNRNIVTEWIRFELAIFTAILLGTWLGRGLKNSGDFIGFVLCATAGNIWINTPMAGTQLAIPETAGHAHFLFLLRMPWPPQVGLIGMSPSLTEVLCFCAILEAARNLNFHSLSIVFGALSGFCGGAFLSLDPPSWPALPALLCGIGTLVASWPDLKMKAHDAVRALLIGVTLMTLLLALTLARRKLAPQPEPTQEPVHYPGTARIELRAGPSFT
jgi:hypothetical protein